MKKIIHTTQAPTPLGPYSQAIKVGDVLYVSGQVGIDPNTHEVIQDDLDGETHQVMKNIQAILHAADMDFNHIIKTTIFLADMDHYASVNDIYGSYFSTDFPAREAIEVARLPKNVNVEISVIAIK